MYLEKCNPKEMECVKTYQELLAVLPMITCNVETYLKTTFSTSYMNEREDQDELNRAVRDWAIGQVFGVTVDA